MIKELNQGYVVIDPTRTITYKWKPVDIPPSPKLKWYQKAYDFFWDVYNSDAFLWLMIILLRGLQAACIGFLVWWFAGGYRMLG